MGKKSSSSKATKQPTPPPASSESETSSRSPSPAPPAAEDDSSASEPGSLASKTPSKAPVAKPVTGRISKYKPPHGLKLVKNPTGTTLDFDEIAKNPNLELWAVRVPDGIKASSLDGLTIQLPSSSKTTTGPIGSFKPKKSTSGYDIFLADDETTGSKRKREDDDDEQKTARGGEEMRSVVPLLPRKSAGDKLFQAPRPITRSLIVTRSLPTSILSHLPSATASLIDSQPSPVPGAILSHDELLKPEVIKAKKIVRPQPDGIKFRIALAGMGAVGGRGTFHNEGVVVEALQPQVLPREDEVDGVAPMEGVEGDVMQPDAAVVVKKEKKKSKKDPSERKSKKVKREAEDGA